MAINIANIHGTISGMRQTPDIPEITYQAAYCALRGDGRHIPLSTEQDKVSRWRDTQGTREDEVRIDIRGDLARSSYATETMRGRFTYEHPIAIGSRHNISGPGKGGGEGDYLTGGHKTAQPVLLKDQDLTIGLG